jgi:hypothetical protein
MRAQVEPAQAVDSIGGDVAFFHELDAWTEYWDVYHPETRGRFYFGDGSTEDGLLTRFLPRERFPPPFLAWKRWALGIDPQGSAFVEAVRLPDIAEAVLEVDGLVDRLFRTHFGDPSAEGVADEYLRAIWRFATDALPPAVERLARVRDDDPRRRTAGRHTLDGDIMWFAWALHTQAAHVLVGADSAHPRRTLQLAGVAMGCAANFAWRGHRRTRPEYGRNSKTAATLLARGREWSTRFDSATAEVSALYRLREWGHAD